VTGTALALAPEAGIELAHAFLLGMFHDVGKLDELHNGGSHEQIGADIARAQLRTHFSHQIVTLLTNVIAKKASSLNPYTRLVHDADKLDKIGAAGIARRLSTSSGTQFAALALSRVEEDLDNFPEMHFPTSQRMAESKRSFTEMFLALFIRPGSPNEPA
jgi:HD superfamily phosphodiesterase